MSPCRSRRGSNTEHTPLPMIRPADRRWPGGQYNAEDYKEGDSVAIASVINQTAWRRSRTSSRKVERDGQAKHQNTTIRFRVNPWIKNRVKREKSSLLEVVYLYDVQKILYWLNKYEWLAILMACHLKKGNIDGFPPKSVFGAFFFLPEKWHHPKSVKSISTNHENTIIKAGIILPSVASNIVLGVL